MLGLARLGARNAERGIPPYPGFPLDGQAGPSQARVKSGQGQASHPESLTFLGITFLGMPWASLAPSSSLLLANHLVLSTDPWPDWPSPPHFCWLGPSLLSAGPIAFTKQVWPLIGLRHKPFGRQITHEESLREQHRHCHMSNQPM